MMVETRCIPYTPNTATTLDATEGSFACYLTDQEREALLAPHEHKLVSMQAKAEGCFGATTVALLCCAGALQVALS